MITCEIFRRHVETYVDGEIDPTAQLECEQHAAGCPPCREHLAFARSFRVGIREAIEPVQAPASLRDRIGLALDAEDRRQAREAEREARRSERPKASLWGVLDPGRSEDEELGLAEREGQPRGVGEELPPWSLEGLKLRPVRARYAVPAAAAVALLAAAIGGGGNPVEDTTVNAGVNAGTLSIFEDVVRRHSSDHPAEIQGSQSVVRSWFRGKLEFPVRPVEFNGANAQLVGARLSNVYDRQAAAFYYSVNGRRVTVMVFEPRQHVWQGAERVEVGGHRVYYQQVHGYTIPVIEHDGLTYAIAGDLDSRSLLQLAASARFR